MTDITVRLPTALEDLAGTDEVTVPAADVAGVIAALDARFPGMRARLLTPEGEIRPLVNIFVGVDNVRDLKGLATEVSPGATVQIMAAVAGG